MFTGLLAIFTFFISSVAGVYTEASPISYLKVCVPALVAKFFWRFPLTYLLEFAPLIVAPEARIRLLVPVVILPFDPELNVRVLLTVVLTPKESPVALVFVFVRPKKVVFAEPAIVCADVVLLKVTVPVPGVNVPLFDQLPAIERFKLLAFSVPPDAIVTLFWTVRGLVVS